MRMVHCEDCGKRYDYDVDGFCPRCGAFNQPVWVRSSGTAAAAESPAAQQKRTGRLQRELGENLRQAEMAMGRLLKEQSTVDGCPAGTCERPAAEQRREHL